ncbi:MAG: cyclic nucleotide-binding domain-containing protein [Alphaproteobacteria bacterium]|nr:cyclic nucleotide-binding domain-containing protein [Alphaproteobacteria bacterium]
MAQGAHSESMCLLVSGRLRVELTAEGRRLLLGEVGPGGWVGEMSHDQARRGLGQRRGHRARELLGPQPPRF